MPSVTCTRCGHGGYTTPPVRVQIPASLVDREAGVPEFIVVEPRLCANCRGLATHENKRAVERSQQRGEAG